MECHQSASIIALDSLIFFFFHCENYLFKVPAQIWKEHSKEVCCLDWNQTRQQQTFLSSSWDQTIRLVCYSSLY